MSSIAKLKAGLDSSYQTNDDARKVLASQGLKLDTSLSGQRAKVYVDDQGLATVAYRGTNNKKDVITDGLIMAGLGRYTNRVKHSKKVMKEAQNKYGDNTRAVGHSLGGYLAENSGAKGRVTTYNKLATGRNTHNKKQVSGLAVTISCLQFDRYSLP